MNKDRVLLQRFCEVEHRRELLVRDLNELRGPFRRLLVASDDRRDLLSDESDAVCREDVPILHVEAEAMGEFFAGYHAHHPGDLLRRGRVDALDQRVGVRALDDLRVKKLGPEVQIVDVLRGACDLVQAVDAAGGLADVFEFCHDRLLATALIAFTIGS